MMNSFAPMADFDLNKIVEEKKVTIRVSNQTKTRLNTSLKVGEAMKAVNWEMEGFKTHEAQTHSMWTGNVSSAYYFKNSKLQSYYEYLEYIKAIVKKFCDDRKLSDKIDILTVEFIDRNVVWK